MRPYMAFLILQIIPNIHGCQWLLNWCYTTTRRDNTILLDQEANEYPKMIYGERERERERERTLEHSKNHKGIQRNDLRLCHSDIYVSLEPNS